MGCSGQLTCRRVRMGKFGGPMRYTYFQVYRDSKLIDCVRTLAIARRMYGKVTMQPGM